MSRKDSDSLNLRPTLYTRTLVDNMQQAAKIKRIPPRRRLYLMVGETHYCYLIIEGLISFHRRRDDMTVGTLAAPYLLGISNTEGDEIKGYIKTITPCTIGIMTVDEAFSYITENELWPLLSRHLMGLTRKIYSYSQNIAAPSTYEIVRLQLQELMEEDPYVRANTTIENYISSKVHLSRSSIMRILAELRNKGHIEIHRGILIKIISLPEQL